MRKFDWLTLVWAAAVPSYSVLITLVPAATPAMRNLYLLGSGLWFVLIVLLIKREARVSYADREAERAERHAAFEEYKQVVHDKFVEAALIKGGDAKLVDPATVKPSPRLFELSKRERELLSLLGYGAEYVAPAQVAIKQQMINFAGDQAPLPPAGGADPENPQRP
jgi:hypothetical protein